jgi:hypothetical protein
MGCRARGGTPPDVARADEGVRVCRGRDVEKETLTGARGASGPTRRRGPAQEGPLDPHLGTRGSKIFSNLAPCGGGPKTSRRQCQVTALTTRSFFFHYKTQGSHLFYPYGGRPTRGRSENGYHVWGSPPPDMVYRGHGSGFRPTFGPGIGTSGATRGHGTASAPRDPGIGTGTCRTGPRRPFPGRSPPRARRKAARAAG